MNNFCLVHAAVDDFDQGVVVRVADAVILRPHAADLSAHGLIPLHARRAPGRIRRPGLVFVIHRRGGRPLPADRPDLVPVPVPVDEIDHYLRWRSSSAAAKKADALPGFLVSALGPSDAGCDQDLQVPQPDGVPQSGRGTVPAGRM